MKGRILIDTNLLVLFVVGIYDTRYIAKHKNVSDYSIEDFESLCILLEGSDIVVTPHILTEASNLLWQTSAPHKHHIRKVLGDLIPRSVEHHLQSTSIVLSDHFPALGLTDAGILELPHGSGKILTVDLDLHLAALNQGIETDNFNHYRVF